MIEPSKGRDDLDYRYHVTLEQHALLDAGQREMFETGAVAPCGPDDDSGYPELSWCKSMKLRWASPSMDEAVVRVKKELGEYLFDLGVYYCFGFVRTLAERVLLRTQVHITHAALVADDIEAAEGSESQ